ncbi:hypothetical protein GQ602_005754 [Ophiocordyceps camponoti-floridani]|uniref:Uncharacterized protein n=1 Tax=Ophiocordyceps camponoti-floridani TaxID=2030778 RepID=A0A8H4VC59_9HYPO|nr:hypothetical protein GQ602_005754 [Ophiocordyceps camponoti-floridani]
MSKQLALITILTLGTVVAVSIPDPRVMADLGAGGPKSILTESYGDDKFLFSRRLRQSHNHYTHIDHHLGFDGHHHDISSNSRERLYKSAKGSRHGRRLGDRSGRTNRHSTHRETTYPEFSVHVG